ncbi:MAG: TonB-dependent receptor, partial [Bacteroidota bacterium]
IDHESIYSNLLFNSIIGNTKNKFTAGLTFAYDGYDEVVNNQNFERVDRSAGAFFEFNHTNLEKVSFTAGLRVDTHNRLGNFVTPRFHIRYTPWEKGSLRGSFGIGRRAPNVFAENQRLFASSRNLILNGNGGNIYGFDAEKAVNYGVSFLQGFSLFDRPGNFSVDFYRTDFDNQIVVDWENPREVIFSNLDGKSYANSLQIELNHELLPKLEVRTAYKFYDVKTDYQTGLLQKPLQARHRFFANVGYNTQPTDNGAQWRFDYTLHALGEQRLPDTSANPVGFQLGDFAEGYALMNAQVTKVFSKRFEVYLGGENLTDFRQDNPVLGSQDPFGTNFDTTIVYAPIFGRMVYAGFRFKS